MSNEDPALPEGTGELEEPVDLDLDAEDVLLREAVSRPITVKVAGKVITVPHPDAWPHAANEAAFRADFSTWARGALSDEDFKAFVAANLRNYQVQAIFKHVNRRNGTDPGKSPGSRGSSKSTRRR